MNMRSILVVVLAVICGGAAAYGTLQLSKGASGPAVAVETVSVVVAKVDVQRGYMLSADQLDTRDWPKEFVPAGTISTVEEAAERAVLQKIVVGEPLLEGKLAAKGAVGGAALQIPKKMRAYTISTSSVASKVAGLVLPGNHVDILLTLKRSLGKEDTTGGGITNTLLQNIEILAVGTVIDTSSEDQADVAKANSVTLLVTPEEVTLLDLAQSMGQLALSLRNPEDTFEAVVASATVKDILYKKMGLQVRPEDSPVKMVSHTESVDDKPAKKKAQQKKFEIMVYHGTSPGIVTVTKTNGGGN